MAKELGKSARQESENMRNVWQKCFFVGGHCLAECNEVHQSATKSNGVERANQQKISFFFVLEGNIA